MQTNFLEVSYVSINAFISGTKTLEGVADPISEFSLDKGYQTLWN